MIARKLQDAASLEEDFAVVGRKGCNFWIWLNILRNRFVVGPFLFMELVFAGIQSVTEAWSGLFFKPYFGQV
jgi:hypothetical protein